MDREKALGINPKNGENLVYGRTMSEYANMKLAAMKLPVFGSENKYPVLELARPLLETYEEFAEKLSGTLCPADERISEFLSSFLAGVSGDDIPKLPPRTFVLDMFGLARELSLPPDSDKFENAYVKSYRVKQGVLHNPANDRRTTAGVFHVVEGGLPVPDDKKSVPKIVFKNMLIRAFNAPEDLLEFPFTSTQDKKARAWVSLFMRPVVCPEIPNVASEKSMEIRLFAPGGFVSNLDFAESIFGNSGNPYLSKNDSASDPDSWTGHTGCIVLAPHINKLTKRELGLPREEDATPRQRRDGMFWSSPGELYNDGKPFKLTARDASGVIFTIISDNYFGYTKKEVKTFISFSANLYGQAEEEHSGGAVAFSSWDLGDDFDMASYSPNSKRSFAQTLELLGDSVEVNPDGWASDKKYPDIVYVREDSKFSLREQKIYWFKGGEEKSIRLSPNTTYVSPCGYKVEMKRPHASRGWRLVGTVEEGVYCHKPATVSGGGKSELSKDIANAIIHGPSIVADFKRDIAAVSEIIDKNYGDRYKDPLQNKGLNSRPILDSRRSMGSVVKLLSPSDDYTDSYNEWLRSIPFYIREFVLTVKRHYRPKWGDNWKKMFSVDAINGKDGNILKYKSMPVITSYLRVGFSEDGSWRTFSLRKDFAPSFKIQMEDDITSSIVVPRSSVEKLNPAYASEGMSLKFTENCEYRLFQRPDEAVVRGYDARAESDMSKRGVMFSNYEPLTREDVRAMADDTIRFEKFTEPMREVLSEFLNSDKPDYAVCSANPRIVGGKPGKNVRYLQNREDMTNPRAYYLAEIGTRLGRGIELSKKVPMPVNAVISGRRNNPPQEGIKPLCVHSPLHYLELPELFMEYIASMTGKSPSTVGAGLEGALTKAPFNAVCPITDLNNALVSFALCGFEGWLSAAGYLGPKYRIDHDISLLVPEVWARMKPCEISAKNLIENGMLERCRDMEYNGRKILSSRLGWRITEEFVIMYFGRIFSNPSSLFSPDMLRPELQGVEVFADSMDNIVDAHRRAAEAYFADGSIEGACPPLKALLHIMKYGSYEGKGLEDIRPMFDRDNIIKSEWYAERLISKQQRDLAALQKILSRLRSGKGGEDSLCSAAKISAKINDMRGISYLKSLKGTIGLDPFLADVP